MPLPPAREQERILAEVDGLDTGRGSAAQDTRICRDRIDRLRQSILKWAFEGRLVDGRSAFSDGQQASAAHEVVDGGK
jgi:type I restriction enzyme S subunit